MGCLSNAFAIGLATIMLFTSVVYAQKTPLTSVPKPGGLSEMATLKDAQMPDSVATQLGLAATPNPFAFITWKTPNDTEDPQQVKIFGLTHTALGNAKLSAPSVHQLVVSNIGIGGGDGVLASLLPGTELWHGFFDGIGNAQSYPPGSFFQITSFATINGIPNQVFASGRATVVGSQWALSFDFSRVTSEPLIALYSLKGFPVASEIIANPSEAFWYTSDTADDGSLTPACWTCDPPYSVDVDLTWTKGGGGIYLVAPSGKGYIVDSLDLAPTKLDVTFGGYSGASLTASGIPSFSINNEKYLVNVSGGPMLFSDLGAGGTTYQCCASWVISGSSASGGTSSTVANEFQVVSSGSVSQIDVALGYTSGVNSFYVNIAADNNGQPGAVLASFPNLTSSTSFGSCCDLISITGISGLSLTPGTNYWMVVGPTNLSSTTLGAWNLNSTGQTGLGLISNDGGHTWVSAGQQTLGAFDILASPIK